MKKYMKPELTLTHIHTEYNILAGSGGLTTGSTPGDEYTPNDETYSRRSGLWDED